MTINDKIKQVLIIKNLSPSYLADDIGVQRSSISHILSGRNRPSLDIIQKIVRRFPEFTYEWFLDSDLQLSTDSNVQDEKTPPRLSPATDGNVPAPRGIKPSASPYAASLTSANADFETIIPNKNDSPKASIDRILIFYTDGTFREYISA